MRGKLIPACTTAVIKHDAIKQKANFWHIKLKLKKLFFKKKFLRKNKDQINIKASMIQQTASKKIKDCKNKFKTKTILKTLMLLRKFLYFKLSKTCKQTPNFTHKV